ncbi:glycerol-3-phosphate dehydrogenase [Indioceanicola profundi]|uniref:glycerol-3-phosphate dehydrogenase n=1 Tax=Indioceanicola profundi TaxID=2220096 RepID=UPI000E6AD2D4|nr:glycerol-3-phosphate dehydrogenase [Indioceanicola profundi]
MHGSRAAEADLLVIGGGINGAGIARDAAGRGLSVILCEQGDLARATSSASTKLIHGGLRYLEHYEFRLVREALIEREVLLRLASHIIRPLRFVLPHERSMRPAWLLRLGLFLYDHLGGRRRLPGSGTIDLRRHPAGEPLARHLTQGFEYSDCWVEDSRLVVLNAMDARERGADILTRTRLVSTRRQGGLWQAELEDISTGHRYGIGARALVNAAGPWVGQVLVGEIGAASRHRVRLVKGSHIVVPRIYPGDHAYIFQNPDRRIVFAIPYEGRFTLIGTTDVDHAGDPAAAEIGPEEVKYLCRSVSAYLARPVTPEMVVWSYSGVRPLQADEKGEASAVTRDYVLELDEAPGPPLLSVFGGKITTYRRLSEHAMELLLPKLGRKAAPWTGTAPLPGGDMPGADFSRFLADLMGRYPWLPAALARRYARSYGTRTNRLLDGCHGMENLGRDLGGGVHEAELAYAVAEEFVRTGEDFLWRRTRLGLHLDAAALDAVTGWIAARGGGRRAAVSPRVAVRRSQP